MASDYKSEFVGTSKLETDGITMYSELIGELRYEIEIERIDTEQESKSNVIF